MAFYDDFPNLTQPRTAILECAGMNNPIDLDTVSGEMVINNILIENFHGTMTIFKGVQGNATRIYIFHIGLNISKNLTADGLNRSVSGKAFSYVDTDLTITRTQDPTTTTPLQFDITFPDGDQLRVLFHADHHISIVNIGTNTIPNLLIQFSGFFMIPGTSLGRYI